MNFLEKLDLLMADRGLNKSTLSKSCDIPYTTIDGWYKKGYEGLKLTTLRKLSDYFCKPLDYWVNDDEASSPTAEMATQFNLQQKITYLKAMRGLTTDDLASLSGVSKGVLDDILGGDSSALKPIHLTGICNALGCSVDYLVNDNIGINDFYAKETAPTHDDLDSAIFSVVGTLTEENKKKILELANLYSQSQ